MHVAKCEARSIFGTEWQTSWNEWTRYAKISLRASTDHEKWMCARLLVPLSRVETAPSHERHRLRSVAGLFRFRVI